MTNDGNSRDLVVAKWLAKIKQQSDVGCRLYKRAREQRHASGESTRTLLAVRAREDVAANKKLVVKHKYSL